MKAQENQTQCKLPTPIQTSKTRPTKKRKRNTGQRATKEMRSSTDGTSVEAPNPWKEDASHYCKDTSRASVTRYCSHSNQAVALAARGDGTDCLEDRYLAKKRMISGLRKGNDSYGLLFHTTETVATKDVSSESRLCKEIMIIPSC